MPIIRVKSVKIYTGQKKCTRVNPWRPWQIWGIVFGHQLMRRTWTWNTTIVFPPLKTVNVESEPSTSSGRKSLQKRTKSSASKTQGQPQWILSNVRHDQSQDGILGVEMTTEPKCAGAKKTSSNQGSSSVLKREGVGRASEVVGLPGGKEVFLEQASASTTLPNSHLDHRHPRRPLQPQRLCPTSESTSTPPSASFQVPHLPLSRRFVILSMWSFGWWPMSRGINCNSRQSTLTPSNLLRHPLRDQLPNRSLPRPQNQPQTSPKPQIFCLPPQNRDKTLQLSRAPPQRLTSITFPHLQSGEWNLPVFFFFR